MIPVNEPQIAKNARKYLLECIESGWVSSAGKFIDKFESQFANYLGVKYAVTTTSGTSALQLAIAALEIGKGDEVIMPDLTIISCALVCLYQQVVPVFVDVSEETGNINPAKIEQKITKNTRAIMAVHLYGHPCDMDLIAALAKKHHLLLIEDAAEAFGAEIKMMNHESRIMNQDKNESRKAGSIGDVGCFSFYGNKIITSGEGGMVVTNSQKIYEKLKSLKDLAHSKKRRFLHYEVGFNFRMTNLQAALGLAQLEEASKYVEKKRWIASMYNQKLKDGQFLELPYEAPWAKSVYWMYAPRVAKNSVISRNLLRKKLLEMGVDSREYFVPMHRQPVLGHLGLLRSEKYPVSDDLSKRGFYIPSGLAIGKAQIDQVVSSIKKVFNG